MRTDDKMRQHEINKRKKLKQKRRESAKSADMEGLGLKGDEGGKAGIKDEYNLS